MSMELGDVCEMRAVLAPFSKDQLIDLLAKSALVHADIRDHVRTVAMCSASHRRLLIRNVSFQTTTFSLMQLLSYFGEIEEGTVVYDKDGQSRGFAFLTFKNFYSVKAAMEQPLYLDGRHLLLKLAADPYDGPDNSNDISRRKLFVRNLAEWTTSTSLYRAFLPYGAIEECKVTVDHDGLSKGYGFVTFAKAEGAQSALQESQKVIDKKMCFISQASLGSKKRDKPKPKKAPGRPEASPKKEGEVNAPVEGRCTGEQTPVYPLFDLTRVLHGSDASSLGTRSQSLLNIAGSSRASSDEVFFRDSPFASPVDFRPLSMYSDAAGRPLYDGAFETSATNFGWGFPKYNNHM
eukprot:Platyproteum_vivax@DN7414_c0_g1_i1.p1